MKSLIRCLAATCMGALAAASALAQPYPARPVKLVVPYAAGGGTDVAARLLAQKLGERLGQPFVVENRAGAATQAGTAAVVKAAPDGYTLLMGTANLATNVPLFAKLPYDAAKDLAPVALVTKVPVYVFVNASSPIRSMKDLIAQAKAAPGGLSYATAGVGSIPHLAGELFRKTAHANIVHIPYKGSAEAVTSVIGGQTAFAFDNLPPYAAQLKAGKVRAIALGMPQRSRLTPEVPTLQEMGIPMEAYSWWGVLAPARTPTAIIERLQREIAAIVKQPEVQARFAELGIEAVGGTSAEFGAHIKAETAKWSAVVRDAGIQPE